MSPENTPSKFQNWTHRLRDYSLHAVLIIAFTVSLIIYIITCVDIYTAFKSGNSSSNIETMQETNKIFGTLVIIFGIALLFIFSKQLVNIFMKHKYISSFLIIVFSIAIPVSLSMFKIIGEPLALIGILASVIIAPFAPQLIQSFNKENREESGIQKNVSKSSPEFIQENSPTTIQENSPISIHDNSNSSISIQNNFTTNQHVTNNVDKRSERDRATANACKMLDSKDLTSRISAVKTLVNLADSWLEDDPTCKKDEKKCQDIIDILCAYICRPFPLAAKAEEFEGSIVPANYNETKFLKHQTKFREEQQVRRTIFLEISKRVSALTKDNEDKEVNALDPWSESDFNFNQATIFYPLNNLTIGKCNFSSARFYSHANFNGTKFIGEANFKGAQFTQDASFNDVTFNGAAVFSPQGDTKTTFKGKATFNGTQFIQGANFNDVTFNGAVDFSPQGDTKTTFGGIAAFNGTHFIQDIYFSEVTFVQDAYFLDAVFTLIADFTKATFAQNVYSSRVVFPQHAYFVEAIFTQNVYFIGATFVQNASFAGTTFNQNVDFSKVTFTQEAFFHNAIFIRKANFNETIFKKHVPDFVVGNARAWFSLLPAHEDHDFSIHSTSKPIPPGEAELDGVKRQIPVGTVLFDPDSWDEGKWEYTRVSEPAKPIEESDNRGETPSK